MTEYGSSYNSFTSRYELWKKQNIFDDTLTVAVSSNVPTLLPKLLQQNFCPDLFFVQHLAEGENNMNKIPKVTSNGRTYIYHELATQMGFYYDSEKVEPIALIDTSDLMAVPPDTSSEFFSQVYSVLLRRIHAKQTENQAMINDDHLSAYSFIAMSCHMPIAYLEKFKNEVYDSFWKCCSQIHRKIQSLSADLLPMVIVMHGNTNIWENNHNISKTWICCSNEATRDNSLYYRSYDIYPKIVIDQLHYYDLYSKENYSEDQWKQHKISCIPQEIDSPKVTNKALSTGFIGVKFKD